MFAVNGHAFFFPQSKEFKNVPKMNKTKLSRFECTARDFSTIACFIYWYIVYGLCSWSLRKPIYRLMSQKCDHQEIFIRKNNYKVSVALHWWSFIFKTFYFIWVHALSMYVLLINANFILPLYMRTCYVDNYEYYKPNNFAERGSTKGQLCQWDVQTSWLELGRHKLHFQKDSIEFLLFLALCKILGV